MADLSRSAQTLGNRIFSIVRLEVEEKSPLNNAPCNPNFRDVDQAQRPRSTLSSSRLAISYRGLEVSKGVLGSYKVSFASHRGG